MHPIINAGNNIQQGYFRVLTNVNLFLIKIKEMSVNLLKRILCISTFFKRKWFSSPAGRAQIQINNIYSLGLYNGAWWNETKYHMIFTAKCRLNDLNKLLTLWFGSVAEWSKALVLGTSLFGGVGSNPTTAKSKFFSLKIIFVQKLIWCLNKITNQYIKVIE